MSSPVSSPPEPASARWGQQRRLEFIEYRLRWDGKLNRADLTSFFGISVPQASLDIHKYTDAAPGNAVYDRSTRSYLTGPAFEPQFPQLDATRYLADVLGVAFGPLRPEDAYVGWRPNVSILPTPGRQMDSEVLIALIGAMRGPHGLKVRYQSMSREEPTERVISPHALGHDGYRWHVRAWCDSRRQFLDFVIGRILAVLGTSPAAKLGEEDAAWQRVVTLQLVPNPKLSASARRAIELDYGMVSGVTNLECRQALLYYALRHLGLAPDDEARAAAHQVVLKNRAEVERLLDVQT
jgi:hypothetical protein